MRILFFLPQTRHTPAFEWGLDLIQRHLDEGDEVLILTCFADAASCEINLAHRYSVCDKCRAKRRDGFAMLKGKFSVASFLRLTPENQREIAALPQTFASHQALKAFTFDGFDIGMGVASSLISCTRDPDFDLRVHASEVANLLRSSAAIFRSIQNHLRASRFDRLYLFNGRSATNRAAFQAGLREKIPCHIYENGADIHHMQEFIDHLPHDIAYTEALIRQAWDDAPDPLERERIARGFFEKALQGKTVFNFIGQQDPKLLPAGFAAHDRNIAIYNSSEDEFAAIGDEWRNPIYVDQLDGLRRLRVDLEKLPLNVKCHLRMHPHLRNVDNPFTRALRALEHPRFTVIPPESPVSSYALLKACDTVLTFGSSVGIEAVYHSKPSILAGKSFYQNLGGTYNPASHDELLNLLTQPLPPKPIEPALRYGYFFETFGYPFKYFKAESYHTGTFKGRHLSYGKWRDYFWGAIEKFPWLPNALDQRNLKRSLKGILGSEQP